MRSILHTNLALMLTAALVAAVTSGSALAQSTEYDTTTELGAYVDQNNDVE